MGSIRAGLRERWKSFAVATRKIPWVLKKILSYHAGDAGRGTPINRPEVPYYKNLLEEPVGMYVVRR